MLDCYFQIFTTKSLAKRAGITTQYDVLLLKCKKKCYLILFHFKCYKRRLHILMKLESPTKLAPLGKILSSYVYRHGDFKQRNFRVEHVIHVD